MRCTASNRQRFSSQLAWLAVILAGILPARAESWQEALARMPLGTNVAELNRSNCVPLLLHAFKQNETVKALVFMPGATDEFYFFRRAHARLSGSSPSLTDALTALTNQTYIQTTFKPPFLLVHSVEDPLEPLIRVDDAKTGENLRRKGFRRKLLYSDRQWDTVVGDLTFYLNRRVVPSRGSRDSYHFYRHSLAGFNLSVWEALEALSFAGKTTIDVQKRSVVFAGDTRLVQKPALDHIPYIETPDKK